MFRDSLLVVVVLAAIGSVAGCSAEESKDVRHVVAVGDLRLVDTGGGCLDLIDDNSPGGMCWEAPENALAVLARPSAEQDAVLVVVAATVPEVATVELRQGGAMTAGESRRYSGPGRLFTLVVPPGTTGHIVALDDAGRRLASTETLHLREGGTLTTTVYPDA